MANQAAIGSSIGRLDGVGVGVITLSQSGIIGVVNYNRYTARINTIILPYIHLFQTILKAYLCILDINFDVDWSFVSLSDSRSKKLSRHTNEKMNIHVPHVLIGFSQYLGACADGPSVGPQRELCYKSHWYLSSSNSKFHELQSGVCLICVIYKPMKENHLLKGVVKFAERRLSESWFVYGMEEHWFSLQD